jgi:hypothetical protein
MEEQNPCYQVWVRKGKTQFGAKVTAATALTLVSVHRLQGVRNPPKPVPASDTKAGMAKGSSWTPFGGAWSVPVGHTSVLRFIVVPKGGKASIDITVGSDTYTFQCKSGDEAVTAYFRLSVY